MRSKKKISRKAVGVSGQKPKPKSKPRGVKARPVVNKRWFKDQMAKMGISGLEIAKLLGLHPSLVSHMLTGRRAIRLDEAPRWAAILKVSLNDILINAGALPVDADVGGSSRIYATSAEISQIEVGGSVDADFNVRWGAVNGPRFVDNPYSHDMGGVVGCLRVETPGTRLAGIEGTLIYYRSVPDGYLDPEGIERLCLVKVGGHHMIRLVKKGYQEHRHNLYHFGGQQGEFGVILESMTPILWMKF